MSFTAVESIPRHTFGHSMVDTMARPVNGWIHEPPYGAARHVGAAGYYTADQTTMRLPPPSSLMSGAPSGHEPSTSATSNSTTTPASTSAPPPPPHLHTGVKPSYGYHDYQTPSPIQQSSPSLLPPTSQPHHHIPALAQQKRNPIQDLARVSPTLSSTASERSAEDFQDARISQGPMPHLPRIQQQPTHPQNPPQAYQQTPMRPNKRRSIEDHYSEMHPAKLPPTYPQNPRAQQVPQPSSPQSHQTWSPKPEIKTERVKISDLLSNEEPQSRPQRSSVVPQPPMPMAGFPATRSEYRITVRQQPVAARSCGFGERDRRVIDPPPIVQLTIEDPSLSKEEISQRIKYPFSVMHCSIWDSTGEQDNSAMPEDYRQQRRLMGTLVASPFVGIDENGEEGCFFCFPDLSCRTPGSFRLKFVLVIIDPIASTQPGGKKFPIMAEVMSDIFTVYNAKDFPGMQASTPLTKRLKEQGCLISIKKGNEKSGPGARDDTDEDGEEGSSSGRRKRARKN
ncbi:hypothetical protein jhhlp_001908 [Lomentospora prolificans]|uniref:Velvet domain-containing protein n=1 Tax=Lomentospora prolificans TaxID=41688 RepID=A0A2N3NCK5_9PEZI|nr:hypothetical protein jhhlp_001908 [Lomentospora prolificans]